MRRLVHILLSLLVVGIVMNGVLAGCRGWSSDRRLVEADTLIAHGDFDSALTQLRAVDTTALSSDNRAYHALLMVHAAYKAYADSTYLDTTWITRARAAYADGGPYDRHIRTLLYSGCVADELGNPIQAMHWYKMVDKDANADDYNCRGYALMSMGNLYQKQLNAYNIAIIYYRKALDQFERIADESRPYTVYCLTQIPKLYVASDRENRDSIDCYLKQALAKSEEFGMESFYYENLTTMSGAALFGFDYQKSLRCARMVMNQAPDMVTYPCLLYACISYAKLGQMDSALCLFNLAPNPVTVADSVLFYMAKSEIAGENGDVKAHIAYNDSAENIEDKVLLSSQHAKLLEIDQSIDNAHLKHKLLRLGGSYSALWVVLVLVGVILAFAFIRLLLSKCKLRHYRMQLDAMQKLLQETITTLEKEKQDNATAQKEYNHAEKANADLVTVHQTTLELSVVYRTLINKCAKTTDLNQLSKILEGVFTKTFFDHVRQFADYAYDDIASRLAEEKTLSQKEINILCMHICNMPNTFIAVYADFTNTHSVTTLKNSIATKLLGRNMKIKDFDRLYLKKSV